MLILVIKQLLILPLVLSALIAATITFANVQPRGELDVVALELYPAPRTGVQVYLYDVPHRIKLIPIKGYTSSFYPAWSPDGQKLSYRATIPTKPHFYLLDFPTYHLSQGPYAGRGDSAFWAENNELLYLTPGMPYPKDLPIAAGAWHFDAQSPDKTKLVQSLGNDLSLHNPSTRETIQLFDQLCPPYYIRWSPDGKYIAIVHCFKFYIYDVATNTLTEFTQLQTRGYQEAYFKWLSESNRVVFELIGDVNPSQIFVVDAGTNEVTPLFEFGPYPSRFDFRPASD